MSEPTKNEMDIAVRSLERIVGARSNPDMMARFRGIPVNKFDFWSLVHICNLFADKWQELEGKYLDVLRETF